MSDHRNSTSMPISIGELTKNIVDRLSAAEPRTLQGAIYRYRGELNLYLAASLEAEERGETDDTPHNYRRAMEILASWSQPAESFEAAKMALQLAAEEYDMGDSPRIPSMINAALGWFEEQQNRRASA